MVINPHSVRIPRVCGHFSKETQQGYIYLFLDLLRVLLNIPNSLSSHQLNNHQHRGDQGNHINRQICLAVRVAFSVADNARGRAKLDPMERVTRERSRLGHLANYLFKLEAKSDADRRPVEEETGNESQGKRHAADGMGNSAVEARMAHGEDGPRRGAGT